MDQNLSDFKMTAFCMVTCYILWTVNFLNDFSGNYWLYTSIADTAA